MLVDGFSGVCFRFVPVRCLFADLSTIWNINKKERRLRVQELLLNVLHVATLNAIFVEKHIWNFHQRAMHPILCVKEVVRMACLGKTVIERCRSIYSKRISRAKLLLIANKNNLLRMHRCQESFVLLDHSSLIHYYSLKLAFLKSSSIRFAYCCDDYLLVIEDLVLESSLVSQKCLKLVWCEHLDCLDIVAKEVFVLTVKD